MPKISLYSKNTRAIVVCAGLLHTVVMRAQQEDMSTLFDAPHNLAYAVAGLLIGVFVMIFRNRLFVFREREVNALNRSKNAQMALVLQACKVRVWTYDVENQHYYRLAKDGSTEGDYTPLQFSQFFERDDFEKMLERITEMSNGNLESTSITIRGRQSTDKEQLQKQYEVSLKILSKNAQGKIRQLLGMQHDITEEVQKKEQVSQLLMQYHTVFNQSVIDMVSYDEDGVMTDINDKACETFHIADRSALLKLRPTVKDNPGYMGVNEDVDETVHFTCIMDLAETPGFVLPDSRDNGQKLYYEMMLSRAHDSQGRQTGVITAGRNVTEMVESHHHQQKAIRKLQRATERIRSYIDSINYALQVSKVRLMNYSPQSHLLEISDNLSSTQYRLTQIRCIELLHPDYQAQAKRVMRQMDRLRNVSIAMTLCTIMRDKKGRKVWLAFNAVPVFDSEGRVDHYFGMCRNETEMVETEMQLKKETQKAQETELLKNAFLMNMSYEIRTPLNAVLGFARLFNEEHDPADEPVFIEQIKTNSNKMLALVNDALFLSRLDAHMVEFKPAPIDFAIIFEGLCQIGWSNNLQPNVKTLVESPYNHLVVNADEENLSQIIQRLCASAAFHTHTGSIHAKYEYRRGQLIIVIDDTSNGLDKEMQPHVFDRFVNTNADSYYGTGLGMPIVKELVEQMGGLIDLTSEPGKGTTIWITIPCELIEMDKKREIPA